MAKIWVDGREHEVDAGANLLEVCLELGYDLPYFCWHPAMGSVGACRQCAVKQFKDEHDTSGRIVMACMTPAAEGTRISITDPEAKAFRASVIEWLMVNHPHDCPVCDEGGECHLQDMTVMTGHSYRRYRFTKRTYRNQDLGPFVNHEMNRCIQCYRCVRFYRDVAGGADFNVFGCHDHVYFGRTADGTLENEFSGNLAEVCPTGVFTDKVHDRRYARKWDESFAPSVCAHCAVGCNISVAERHGTLRRVVNRFNGEVNGYFLCDRGRFGYDFVNSDAHLRAPLVRSGDTLVEATEEEALRAAAERLADCDRIIGIGSPRASLEANLALERLVGRDNFFSGASVAQHRLAGVALEILRSGPASAASIREIAASDAAVILGEDLLATAPRVALALRQTVREKPIREAVEPLGIPRWHDLAVKDVLGNARGPLVVATPDATGLDPIASQRARLAPDDIARLGFAIAGRIGGGGSAATGDALDEVAAAAATDLLGAERPVVIAGTSLGSEAVLRAAAALAAALVAAGKQARLVLVLPEANSMGAAMLGGGDLDGARTAIAGGRSGVLVLENDLTRRAGTALVDEVLGSAAALVVIDTIRQPTAERAHVVLPAGSFAESDGTYVSLEGRAQRFFQALPPRPPVTESWRWLQALGAALQRGGMERWERLEDVLAALAAEHPELAGAAAAAPPASLRLAGKKIPRQPHRATGRTANLAHITVYEPKPPSDPDSPLAFSMEGFGGQPPPAVTPFFWAPGWNSVQSVNKFQEEIGSRLRGGNPGVRLIEPAGDAASPPAQPPSPFAPASGRLLLVPAARIFGSEELSSLSPPIRQRMTPAVLGLNPADAGALGVADGALVEVRSEGVSLRLPAVLRPALPRGVASLPAGLPGVPFLELPASATVARSG